MKIMVVDDSGAMRTLIRRMLLSFGGRHQIVEARDGQHALEVFNKERPGLILLDWDMPSLSGVDFLRAFDAVDPSIIIGMVTANHGEQHRRTAEQLGANFLLGKPFTREQLREAIGPYLEVDTTPSPDTSVDQPTQSGYGFEAAVVDSLNRGLDAIILREQNASCPVTGSAGIVVCFEDETETVRCVVAVEWTLCLYLNSAFEPAPQKSIAETLRTRRTTPQMRENLREIINIIRGVCRERVNTDLSFGAIAFRGDGQLRDPSWKSLLESQAFKQGRTYDIGLKVEGLGQGALSIYLLPQNEG